MGQVDKNFFLRDFLDILDKRKGAALCIFTLCVFIAFLYAFLIPPTYKAESVIFSHSSQSKASMASLMMQMGGMADGLGGGGFATDIFVSVLSSNGVVDKIIDRFNLMSLYKQNVRLKMRQIVANRILEVTKNNKSGVITVAVFDEDPVRAAEMANAFVDELKAKLQFFSFGEASQRRIFFEEQTKQAFDVLGIAEDKMLRYQESKGVVAMEPQLEATLKAVTTLRSQIAEQEVSLSALKTYAKKENPALKLAESQLSAMRKELSKLEAQHEKAGIQQTKSETLPSMQGAPLLGMEYQRHLRDVKFATAMYEVMLKQLEVARLDEARDSLIVQVIDPATPPDYKAKPQRLFIVILGAFIGLSFGVAWALLGSYVDAVKIIRAAQTDSTSRG